MRPWRSYRHNPIDWLRSNGVTPQPWLLFDPTIVKGVTPHSIYRARQHRHDGTLLFTIQAAAEVLEPLIERMSFYIPDPPERHPEQAPFYRLGWLRFASTFPPAGVNLPAGHFPGMRERVSISYVVEWR